MRKSHVLINQMQIYIHDGYINPHIINIFFHNDLIIYLMLIYIHIYKKVNIIWLNSIYQPSNSNIVLKSEKKILLALQGPFPKSIWNLCSWNNLFNQLLVPFTYYSILFINIRIISKVNYISYYLYMHTYVHLFQNI